VVDFVALLGKVVENGNPNMFMVYDFVVSQILQNPITGLCTGFSWTGTAKSLAGIESWPAIEFRIYATA